MRQQIDINPSFYLAILLMAAHCAAAAALWFVLPPWALLTLACVLGFSLLYYLLRDAWLRLPGSCIALVVDEGLVVLLRGNGSRTECRVMSGSLVTPALTVLTVLPQGARLARSIVLLPDSVDPESFRRLRVWLRWGHASFRGNAPGRGVHEDREM